MVTALLAVASLAGAACRAPAAAAAAGASAADVMPDVRCPAPIVMTLHRDLSRSAAPHGIPPITEADLRVLVDGVLRVCGGELLFGEIGANSNRPFQRLRVSEPPPAPKRPTFDANPFIRADQEKAFVEARNGWLARRRAWAQSADVDANLFFSHVRPALERAPDEQSTDIYGAIERATLALAEPDVEWSAAPRKLVILVTDGLHTARHPPTGRPPADITVVVVGTPGVLQPWSPPTFEGMPAALRYLRALAMRKG